MTDCTNCKKCLIKKNKEEKKKLLEEGNMKCSKCDCVKSINDFNLQNPKTSPTRRRPNCKDCRKQINKSYYSSHFKKETKKENE